MNIERLENKRVQMTLSTGKPFILTPFLTNKHMEKLLEREEDLEEAMTRGARNVINIVRQVMNEPEEIIEE